MHAEQLAIDEHLDQRIADVHRLDALLIAGLLLAELLVIVVVVVVKIETE